MDLRCSGKEPEKLPRLEALVRCGLWSGRPACSLPEDEAGQNGPASEELAGPCARAEFCPYRGLLPFREEDAGLFFGRAAVVAELQALLEQKRWVRVVGRRGGGKTSLLQAGLVPRLRRDHQVGWEVALMVDEGFVQEARGFEPLDELRLPPLTRAELREAMVRPAGLAGVAWDEPLVDRLLDDTEPAAQDLARFQLTLRRLWEQRRGTRLGLQDYATIGGIQKAARAATDNVPKPPPPQPSRRGDAAGRGGIGQAAAPEVAQNRPDQR